jgi:hypothetical protein
MLQTCQQINCEAASIFYGMNVFVFEAVPHLYAFLSHFAPRLPLVRKLGIASIPPRAGRLPYDRSYPENISHMTLNNVFPLLAYATSLEVLYMNTSIYQSLSSRATLAARRFYHCANVWLWAMVLCKRDPLSIIRLPAPKPLKGASKQWSTSKKGQDEFLAELAARLVVSAQAEA